MFSHILVPLDGSTLAEQILPLASVLAARCRSRVTLLHLLERRAPPTIHADRHLTRQDEAEDYLRELSAHTPCSEKVEWHVHAEPVSDVGRGIVEHAEELGADLIAVTTHGAGGLSRLLFGSIAQQVLSRCSRPILLLPATLKRVRPVQVETMLEHFLVPLSLEPEHDRAVEIALELARLTGARLRLLGVAETAGTLRHKRAVVARLQPGTSNLLLQAEAQLMSDRLQQFEGRAAELGVAVETAVALGRPADQILAAIEENPPGLVVLASHRHRGLEAVISGSVGQKVVNQSRAPLLMLPV
jgi:nucleotide-binding universal stress UspA family protein